MDVKRKLSRLEKWFSGANLVKFATTFNICIRPQRHLKILQLHERERKVKQNHGQFRLLVLEKTYSTKKNSMPPLSKSNLLSSASAAKVKHCISSLVTVLVLYLYICYCSSVMVIGTPSNMDNVRCNIFFGGYGPLYAEVKFGNN